MKSLLGYGALILVAAGCSIPDVTSAPVDQGDAPATDASKSGTSKSTTSTTGSLTPVDTTSDPKTDTSSTTPTSTSVTTTSSSTKAGTFTGSLDSTSVVAFGGGTFCNYQVVLTNLQVSLTVDGQGRASASSVSGTMTESLVQDGCNATPLGSLPYAFSYTAPEIPPSGITITEVGDADNTPASTLIFAGTPSSASTVHAQLTFHRTDGATDSLNWLVEADVDLTAN